MNEFLLIAIVGVIASLIIEGINRLVKADSFEAKIITTGVAIVIGTGYVFFSQTIWWQTMLGILGAASTVYAFLLKSKK